MTACKYGRSVFNVHRSKENALVYVLFVRVKRTEQLMKLSFEKFIFIDYFSKEKRSSWYSIYFFYLVPYTVFTIDLFVNCIHWNKKDNIIS